MVFDQKEVIVKKTALKQQQAEKVEPQKSTE